ncbi:ankyrin repeat-containing protein, partial [Trifolium medium]|nr:ankyrin repeat-containing protein [Trifolium medium]
NNPQHPQSPSPPSQPSSHNPSPSKNRSQPSPTPSIANETLHKLTRWDVFENFCNTYIINEGYYWITKEQLMVAATVIATMTFQSVISPPGGVWQEDTTTGGVSCADYGFCEAGTSVWASSSQSGHSVDFGDFNGSCNHIHVAYIHVGVGIS